MFQSPDSSDGEQEREEPDSEQEQEPEPTEEPDIIHSLPWKVLTRAGCGRPRARFTVGFLWTTSMADKTSCDVFKRWNLVFTSLHCCSLQRHEAFTVCNTNQLTACLVRSSVSSTLPRHHQQLTDPTSTLYAQPTSLTHSSTLRVCWSLTSLTHSPTLRVCSSLTCTC